MNQKTLKYVVEFYYLNVSKIRNFPFIFQNFAKTFLQLKKKNFKNSFGF